MAKRQATPNILGDVLGTAQPAPAQKQPDTEPVAQDKPKSSRPKKVVNKETSSSKKTRKPAKRAEAATEEVEKQKATFYVAQSALDELEDVWIKLRRMTKGSKGSVSKSGIVEVALQTAIADFQSNGKDSSLAQSVLE